MEIREYGQEHSKQMLLLPPKYMTGRIFEFLIRYLKDWHIYCVSYDGFDDRGCSQFTSCSEEAEKLARYFESRQPLDAVYGHGLGASIALALPESMADAFVIGGFEFADRSRATEALKIVMPHKQHRLLMKMNQPISMQTIQKVLNSDLPDDLWKAWGADPAEISRQSVEAACSEELEMMSGLSADPAMQRKLTVLYGQRQYFNSSLAKAQLPEARFVCLENFDRDGILFRPKLFEKYISEARYSIRCAGANLPELLQSRL